MSSSKMTEVLGSYQPESEPTGYCPVGTCTAVVPERVLVCRDDLAKVPDELLDAYQQTYRRGQNAATATEGNKAALAAIIKHCAQVAA